VLISAQVTLPGITSDRVGARRSEIWAPTAKHADSEDQYATVAANAPTIMIAEKAADLILGKTRLSAATLCRASQRNCARDEAAE